MAALGIVLGAAACNNDVLFHNTTEDPVHPMFTRYVAMGNSITAGFQSGGINDSTQMQGYPVLLARQMHTPFFMPLLNKPGCTPPIVDVFRQTVVPGATPVPGCGLLETQNPAPPYYNDVAVPGATSEDPLSNIAASSGPNPLTTFFLGGLTQNQAMQRIKPTFVTVWIGNNDVLTAATDTGNAGNPAQVTAPATFAARYDSILTAVDATPASGKGVLIGVVDVAAIPYFSYGQVYFAIKNTPGGPFPPTFVVLLSCSPSLLGLGGVGDTTLVPFRYGAALLAKAQAGVVDTLDCANDHNITPSELANLHASVLAYDTHIATVAAAKGYAFFDPNAALGALRADTSKVVIFPHFPKSATDTSAGVVQRPFGSAFSRDGVHPSQSSQTLIADSLAARINAKYGTTLRLP
jgi:hypothetical protein